MDDCIYRQVAIEDIREYKIEPNHCCDESEIKGYNDGLDTAISALATLPSAQPEPLTDREKMIFLSAMEREKKVCEQWGDYDDSLVKTCHEITRKVRSALWT